VAYIFLGIRRSLRIPVKLLVGDHPDGQMRRMDTRQCLNSSTDTNHRELVLAETSEWPSEHDHKEHLFDVAGQQCDGCRR
jgi:hypothetical protein